MIVISAMSFQVFANNINVSNAYIRATIPGTTVSSAYMTITNDNERQLTLLGASSSISQRIEIHQHVMKNGMMRMLQRDKLKVPANGSVTLEPGGYHLMIFDLTTPLKPEQQVTMTLHFADSDNVELSVPVQSIKSAKLNKSKHHH